MQLHLINQEYLKNIHLEIENIDVETTGLLPGHHEMIDVGIVMILFSSANELN